MYALLELPYLEHHCAGWREMCQILDLILSYRIDIFAYRFPASLSFKLSQATVTWARALSRRSAQISSTMIKPERFNAKARRSSTAGSSHKRGKHRPKKQPDMDTNSEIIQRKTAEEKELDRREQLKKEVRVHV
jgi:hypothetical protein